MIKPEIPPLPPANPVGMYSPEDMRQYGHDCIQAVIDAWKADRASFHAALDELIGIVREG